VSHHKNDYKYPAGFACDTCHYIQWLATRFFAQCLHRAFSEKAKAHLLAQNKKTFEVGGNEGPLRQDMPCNSKARLEVSFTAAQNFNAGS